MICYTRGIVPCITSSTQVGIVSCTRGLASCITSIHKRAHSPHHPAQQRCATTATFATTYANLRMLLSMTAGPMYAWVAVSSYQHCSSHQYAVGNNLNLVRPWPHPAAPVLHHRMCMALVKARGTGLHKQLVLRRSAGGACTSTKPWSEPHELCHITLLQLHHHHFSHIMQLSYTMGTSARCNVTRGCSRCPKAPMARAPSPCFPSATCVLTSSTYLRCRSRIVSGFPC
mmetsp:Transcript_36821/g.81894  ORF Transcript_36821/g.81894 Transcript_36821/m.81894 type:complete len:229 (-) Transcript_36821:707-1393(-)